MKNKLEDLSKEELESRLIEMKKELIKLNMDINRGTTLKSPGNVKKLKKNIARLLMKLKAK